MADDTIRIKIEAVQKGMGELNASINQLKGHLSGASKEAKTLKSAGSDLSREFGGLKGILGSLINIRTITSVLGGLSIAGVMKIADAYTLLDNKLKLVTKSETELAYIQDALYRQSLTSHSSYSASIDLYSRFYRATESLGTGQNELLRITETLNKAMIISGATQQESTNAIIQLSQGMASGVLRGEEFNSIMENGSRIAKMLADYLKTDIGGLRKMAMDGKITSEIMVNAFSAATETIDAEFGKMQPTIAQAWTDLQTVFGRLVSDSNKGAEGTKSVADEVQKLADTIDRNRSGIIELFTQIISLAARAAGAIGNIGQSLRGWAAVKSGRLGLLEFAAMNPQELRDWLQANDTQAKSLQNQIDKVNEQIAAQQTRRGLAILPHYQRKVDAETDALRQQRKALQAELEAALQAEKEAPPPSLDDRGKGKPKTTTADEETAKKRQQATAKLQEQIDKLKYSEEQLIEIEARRLIEKEKLSPVLVNEWKTLHLQAIELEKQAEIAEAYQATMLEYQKQIHDRAQAKIDLDLKDLDIAKQKLDKEIELDQLYGRTTPQEALQRQYELELKILETQREKITLRAVTAGEDPEQLAALSKEWQLNEKQIEALRVILGLETHIATKKMEDAQAEFNARSRLAALDLAEKHMTLPKGDVIEGRISAYQDLLARYTRQWEQAAEGTIEKITYADKIDETRAKITDLTLALQEQRGTLEQGLMWGVKSYLYELKTQFQSGVEFVKTSAEAMRQGLEDLFFDPTMANFESFTNTIRRAWARLMSDMVMEEMKAALKSQGGDGVFSTLLGGLGSLLGITPATQSVPGIAGGVPYDASYVPGVGHSGGLPDEFKSFRVVPVSVFDYAVRYHSGIGPDERAAIIRRDEGVFTQGQMKALGLMAQKGQASTSSKTATVINNYFHVMAWDSQSLQEFIDRNPGAFLKPVYEDLKEGGGLVYAMREAVR